jgi:hypothetical protein
MRVYKIVLIFTLITHLSSLNLAAIAFPVFFKNHNTLIEQELAYPDKIEIRKNKPEKIKKEDVQKIITSGKGTWVNIWNYPTDVNRFMTRLQNYHIDTIYLQINRSTTEVFKHKQALDEILKVAHERKIKVIGWSYCYLKDIDTDVKKFTEPALYLSSEGHRLDGMAADIEENISLWAVKAYTEKIKSALPKDYPLIAITFSPKIKQAYPWEYIAQNWDVIMPMVYWHGLKNRTDDTVYNFVKDSIADIRKLSGKQDINIHLITDGDRTNTKEVKLSLEAARDLGINAGISIYPEHLASDEMLESLKNFSCELCGT